MYLTHVHVKGRLDGWAFAGCYYNFFVLVIESRANTIWITHHKGVTVADQASHYIASIKFLTRPS